MVGRVAADDRRSVALLAFGNDPAAPTGMAGAYLVVGTATRPSSGEFGSTPRHAEAVPGDCCSRP